MKRIALSALSLVMLAAPTVGAQAAPFFPVAADKAQVQTVNHVGGHKVVKRTVVKKTVVRKDRYGRTAERKKVNRHRWVRGHRVPAWQRQHVVRDYRHYGLRRPGRDQHWVKVDNDFLLIGIASGLIAGIIAAN